MIKKLRASSADNFVHLRIGLMASVVVAALLVLGLSLRHSYIAELKVDIGGVRSTSTSGITQFTHFEEASNLEFFYSHHVFLKDLNFNGHCSVDAVYSPNGQQLKITCKSDSEGQARALISFALFPLLERHMRPYELATIVYERNQNLIKSRIRHVKQMIVALQKPPVLSSSEAQIIALQEKVEQLHDQIELERMLGNGVLQTQIDSQGVSVRNRNPGFGVWAVVAVMALSVGLFVMMVTASIKRLDLEQEVSSRNA